MWNCIPPRPPDFNVDARVRKALCNLRRICPFKIHSLLNNIEIGGRGAAMDCFCGAAALSTG